jgi:hypothetical protein
LTIAHKKRDTFIAASRRHNYWEKKLKFAALKNTGTIVQVIECKKGRTLVFLDEYFFEVSNNDLIDVLPSDLEEGKQ